MCVLFGVCVFVFEKITAHDCVCYLANLLLLLSHVRYQSSCVMLLIFFFCVENTFSPSKQFPFVEYLFHASVVVVTAGCQRSNYLPRLIIAVAIVDVWTLSLSRVHWNCFRLG